MSNQKVSVRFLAANPVSSEPLGLDEEIRRIKDGLRGTLFEAEIIFDSDWAVRADDFVRILNAAPPDVLHFSGHGTEHGELMLARNDGRPHVLVPEALTFLFGAFQHKVKLVVLNACYSRVQAEAIAQYVDVTIGMSGEVGDQAAAAFAAALYRALAYGKSVSEALGQARAAMIMETGSGAETPSLHVREGIDVNAYYLLRKQTIDYLPFGIAIGSPIRQFFTNRSGDLDKVLKPIMLLNMIKDRFDNLIKTKEITEKTLIRLYEGAIIHLDTEVNKVDRLYEDLSGAKDRWAGLFDSVALSKFAKLLQVVAPLAQNPRDLRNLFQSLMPELRKTSSFSLQKRFLEKYSQAGEGFFTVQVSYTLLVASSYNELLESLPEEAFQTAKLERIDWSLESFSCAQNGAIDFDEPK